MKTLRRPGLIPKRERTCRRGPGGHPPAASDLSRTFEGIGHAEWRNVYPLDSVPGSLRSRGAAIGAIRPPQGVTEDLPKSPRRPRPRRRPVVRAFTARQEVQYHHRCNACWPARKPPRPAGGRKPLLDSTIAGPTPAAGRQNLVSNSKQAENFVKQGVNRF